MDEQIAGRELLDEYELELKAGRTGPAEYLARHPKLDKADVNLATLLTVDGIVRRQEAATVLTPDEIERAKKRLLKKLLGEG